MFISNGYNHQILGAAKGFLIKTAMWRQVTRTCKRTCLNGVVGETRGVIPEEHERQLRVHSREAAGVL